MFLSLLLICVFDGTLVLRNGKLVTYTGTYEVKNEKVLFKDRSGNLLQLPLSLVDLEKTKARAQAAAAAPKAEQPKKKKNPNPSSFQELVRDAKPQRGKDRKGGLVFVENLGPAAVIETNDDGVVEDYEIANDCSAIRSKLSIVEGNLAEWERSYNAGLEDQEVDDDELVTLKNRIKDAKENIRNYKRQIAKCPPPPRKKEGGR